MDLSFFLVAAAAVIAPVIARLIGRFLVVPLIVFEIALGMLLGPSGLGWVSDSEILETFSQMGLALLFFMAGNEIDAGAIRGRPVRRAILGWGLSAVLALVAAAIVGDDVPSIAIIAIALTGTALGTISPILRDSGLNRGPLGASITAAGAIGEFLPLVAITVFLSGREPLSGVLTLVVFVAIVLFAFFATGRREQRWLTTLVTKTLHTSGQFAVRVVIFVLAGLVALALALGVDFLLGAFTAGILARFILRSTPASEQEIIDTKLEAVSFGFFVPLFFVTTGVTFPLRSLLDSPTALALVPIFTVCMLLIRGLPGFLAPPKGTSLSDRRTSGLFAATTLPLVIAVTQIGTDNEVLDPDIAAAMVGGGLLTVLLFPMLALLGHGRDSSAKTGSSATV